jgi:hypothetical protein
MSNKHDFSIIEFLPIGNNCARVLNEASPCFKEPGFITKSTDDIEGDSYYARDAIHRSVSEEIRNNLTIAKVKELEEQDLYRKNYYVCSTLTKATKLDFDIKR